MKTLLMEIFLRLKTTMNQVKTKKLGFEYFCRFGTRALTLRPRNTYVNVFRALFGFCNSQVTCCGFRRLGVSSLNSKLNSESIEQVFWRVNVVFVAVQQTRTVKLPVFF